ncbi:uncharacterized protein F4822DRAFT_192285 [Hypoxylon trugodes]|uniref:uncharacterized protein n=1 Tax=Hypoxylon trugodes TaxID=326681 RepID=UPI00219A9BDA|nr:uncharacterized protein F4822DRAFT_192285 [Hypoxylon trugodes]KAI1391647.1 hypothetical protein F4822DRAFT_192285 [Hypoxylon trugodes]
MKLSGAIALFWALTVAGAKQRNTRRELTVTSRIDKLTWDDPIVKNVARTFQMDSAYNISSIIQVNSTKAPSTKNIGSIKAPADGGECITPAYPPVTEDCESLCDNLSQTQGPLIVQPFEIWHFEAGQCLYGLANLDPCDAISVDPISQLGPYCDSMYSQCIVNGYDGYYDASSSRAAMALTGTAAAPPYPNPGNC